MSPADRRPALGGALLALLATLSGLLAALVAGSKLLSGVMRGGVEGWQLPALSLVFTALAFGGLAHGCRRSRPWLRWYAPLLLLGVVGVALADVGRNALLDLSTAMVALLGALTCLMVIAWLSLPASGKYGYTRLHHRGSGGQATGSRCRDAGDA